MAGVTSLKVKDRRSVTTSVVATVLSRNLRFFIPSCRRLVARCDVTSQGVPHCYNTTLQRSTVLDVNTVVTVTTCTDFEIGHNVTFYITCLCQIARVCRWSLCRTNCFSSSWLHLHQMEKCIIHYCIPHQ